MGTLGVAVAAWFVQAPPERNDTGRPDLPVSYDEAYEQLAGLAPLPGRGASVRGLVLQRDAAEFRLAEGEVFLLSPVTGRTVGAVFVGQGSVSLTPPLEVERREFARLYDAPSLERDFTELVLLFADTTLAEFEAALVFEERPLPRAAAASVEQALKYLHRKKEEEFYAPLMTAVLNGHRNQLFYAQFSERNRDSMFFVVDPYAVEAVRIMREGDDDTHEIVSQFARAGTEARMPAEGPPSVALATVEHYAIESTIAKDLDFAAAATITARSLASELHWLQLGLFHELTVDSIRAESGEAVRFHRGEDDGSVWVELAPAGVQPAGAGPVGLPQGAADLVSARSSPCWRDIRPDLPLLRRDDAGERGSAHGLARAGRRADRSMARLGAHRKHVVRSREVQLVGATRRSDPPGDGVLRRGSAQRVGPGAVRTGGHAATGRDGHRQQPGLLPADVR
jgi:hypothetical protein